MTPSTVPADSLLAATLARIVPTDADALAAAEARQLQLTKPAGSLGQLETLGNRLAAIYRECPPPVPEPALACVFAADHGVQAHGVSPWPQEITWQMGANVLGGGASINVLARHVGADLLLYDLGILSPLPAHPMLREHRLAAGTADFTVGPAMTQGQALEAIEIGITAALEAVASGYRCLIPGEVGIGNTTPSAALISVFTGRGPGEVTGRGAGAPDEMVERKKACVARGIEVNGAAASVGGFEHAAMVGLILGAAASQVPLILDGVIACSAALTAVALCPDALGYLIAGHDGAEPGIRASLEVLGLEPVLALDLRLGEGSGAAPALPVVQAAAKILREMATFESAGVTSEHE
jgi:nicotinate-nucleotide--dimethylbenzimidazole phosphoribosyltransferase